MKVKYKVSNIKFFYLFKNLKVEIQQYLKTYNIYAGYIMDLNSK